MSQLYLTDGVTPTQPSYFFDQNPDKGDFLEEAIVGFSKSPKSISPKFFYDDRGSDIFSKICQTPEYYITRTEISLLEQVGDEIAAFAGTNRVVIEYGCGSSLKINALLSALKEPAEYLAIDIAAAHLQKTIKDIAVQYPNLRVGGLCADFMGSLTLPEQVGGGAESRLAFFPGSTIGNQTPTEAINFMKMVHSVVGVGGALLIGVDLKKDKVLLERAYNDKQGYTAAFNLNLFLRMREELNADINISLFRHLAFYNEQESRIEMHLMAEESQSIQLGGQVFCFAQNETVHTENSYKYSIDEFDVLAVKGGFTVDKVWIDKGELFSIHYLTAI